MSEGHSHRRWPIGTDRRGLSEAVALAVLVGMVLVTTGAVGAYVLVADGESTAAVNFTHQYYDDTDAVLVTYTQGESLPAGDVQIEGPDNEVTWAEAANAAADEPVGVGDAIQLSDGNVYGSTIANGDTFRIYRADGENRTELSTWTAGG